MRPLICLLIAGALCVCGLLQLGWSRDHRVKQAHPTYYKDVEPLLRQNCVECHRPGQTAPFSLLTYADAARRAKQIAVVTTSRFMPPWSAEAASVSYCDNRRLSEHQVLTLQKWVAGGALKGRPVNRPKPLEPGIWPEGPPDKVLSLETPFKLAPDGPDVYHRFVIPLHLVEDRWIGMAAFHPDTPRVTRVAMMSIDGTGLSRKMAARFGGKGYPSMVGQILPTSDVFGEWAPGARAFRMPAGVGVLAKKGDDLVVLVRFHPSGKPEKAQFRVGLYWLKQPPRSELTTIVLGSTSVYVRPGELNRMVRDSFTIPVDVQAFQVLAHAHLTCRRVTALAMFPNGEKRTLLRIVDWNPSWQRPYTFTTPQHLPAGTRIFVEFSYDNSAGDIKGAIFKASAMAEMAYLEIQAATENANDLPTLRQAIRTRSSKVSAQ